MISFLWYENSQKVTKKSQNLLKVLPKTVLFRNIALIFSLEKPCYLENHVVREPCKRRSACTTKGFLNLFSLTSEQVTRHIHVCLVLLQFKADCWASSTKTVHINLPVRSETEHNRNQIYTFHCLRQKTKIPQNIAALWHHCEHWCIFL